MKLSKITQNFAKRRNFEFTVWAELDDNAQAYAVWTIDNDDEPLFIFSRNSIFEIFLTCNLSLSQNVWEELPHWMKSEKDFRDVLDFISKH